MPSCRGGIDQLAVGYQRRRLRQPGRKPERADLPLRLVTRACAAVETVERRRLQEQGFHHTAFSPPTVSRPPASTRNSCTRHNTLRPQKLPRNTAKDKASRNGSSQNPAVGSPSRRAMRPVDAQRRSSDTATPVQAAGEKPLAIAASAAIATVSVTTEPAKPTGAIAREVRAQRSSWRQRLAKSGSVTRFSTI